MAYSILFKQCGSDHMTRGRSRAIDRIVVHYTGTTASARNNATYFARNEGQGASAHYFVDDITPEIYQSVAEGDTAWHAGNWDMNCRAIGIEVVSAGEDYSGTEITKLAWLVQKLMAKYGTSGATIPSVGETSAPSGTVAELARRVIAGEFGNGDARRAALGSRYSEVQAEVNRILAGGSGGGAAQAPAADDVDDLARRVIAGEFGNGTARKAALGDRYAEVQARVNEMLGAGGSSGGSSGGADVDALARAVIRGDYGNGAERKRRLGSLYDAVQARVNEMLS